LNPEDYSIVKTILCPICGEPVKVRLATSARGNISIVVSCPKDGRHFRGFINDPPTIEALLIQLKASQSTGNMNCAENGEV
jgi:hypothetical protein